MVCKTVIRGFDSHLRLQSLRSFRLRRVGKMRFAVCEVIKSLGRSHLRLQSLRSFRLRRVGKMRFAVCEVIKSLGRSHLRLSLFPFINKELKLKLAVR